jgi:hypothetical protein
MDNQESLGSEAFRWLDRNMVAAMDAPDEAFDWVFMLGPDDWILLEQVWPNRSSEWREACAYVIEGPVNPSQRLLRLALADPYDEVATQAAVSICSQVLDHSDEISFDASLAPRLRELRRRNPGRGMEEVDEVLRRYGDAD